MVSWKEEEGIKETVVVDKKKKNWLCNNQSQAAQ